MYKKITIIISFLLAAVLGYLQYRYFQAQSSTAFGAEKVSLLNTAADNFSNVGFIICISTWVLVNITSVKTKQLFWLCIPFLFTVFVSWIMSWQDEDIFIFNKQNGLWKGGFSLSYFFGTAIIIFAAVLLVINYSILKSKMKK